MQNAIRGMVEALDDHSTFLSPDEFEDMQVSTSGAYAGIGVEVVPGKDGVSVVRRMAGSPAERAGIQTGDVIVRSTAWRSIPADLDAAIARMRGPEGSSIRLACGARARRRRSSFRSSARRCSCRASPAELLTPDYRLPAHHQFHRYARPANWNRLSPNSSTLARQRLKGFVIDLRNNPGGVLDAAAQIADDFLDHGTIVSAEGRTADARFRIEAKPGDITNGAQAGGAGQRRFGLGVGDSGRRAARQSARDA